MATENILIKFTSDTTGLKDSVAELQKIGKLSEEDAKKFQMMEGFAEGVADALKEAGIDAKTLNKEISSTVNSGKSLKAQFADAKNEAVKLSREFGATSVQARNAAKSAALLKDEIDDMNGVLKALNPEAKLNAFVNLGQGVQGAFQAATGALQVFGVENERITKLAQQFQGVLNLTQGINSVLQLKDVYTQLRLVLGVTTAAQNGLNASMLANPYVLVGTAVVALVAALIILNDKTEEYKITEEQLNKIKESSIDATEGLTSAEDALAIQRDKNATFDIQRRNENIKLQKDLFNLLQNQKVAQYELNAAQEKVNELGRGAFIGLVKERNLRLDLAKKLKKDADEAIANRFKEFTAIRTTITLKEKEAIAEDKLKNKKKERKKVEEESIQFMKSLGVEAALTNDEIINISDEAFAKMEDALRIVNANALDVKKSIAAINKELNNIQPEKVAIKKTGTDFNKELFDKEDKRRKESAEVAVNLAIESAAFISDLNRTSAQNQIDDLEQQKERGIISEEQYQDRLKKIKTEAAKRDKELAIFSASILFAQALINALTFKPANAVPAAIVLATVTAGINLAKIIATPIPRFKEGTLNVGGGSLDSDGGMQAIIHRGEAIIPADRNREYHPTIKALYNRQVKASDINAFVQNKLSGKMNHNVNAKINSKELARAMDKGNTVKIENASAVGRVIANELSKGYNRRNII
jgi:hypothetical protein